MPLAIILITDKTLFVGETWRFFPGFAAAVTHDDVQRIEYSAGLGGRHLNIVRRDGKRLWFISADLTDLLREHGWHADGSS